MLAVIAQDSDTALHVVQTFSRGFQPAHSWYFGSYSMSGWDVLGTGWLGLMQDPERVHHKALAEAYRQVLAPDSATRLHFTGAQVVSLTGTESLEAGLKAAEPRWRAEFCSDADRPPGAPSLLLVGPSAAEANALIKRLPVFNEASCCGAA